MQSSVFVFVCFLACFLFVVFFFFFHLGLHFPSPFNNILKGQTSLGEIKSETKRHSNPTIEPPVSRRPRDQKSTRLREVSAYRRVKVEGWYVAGTVHRRSGWGGGGKRGRLQPPFSYGNYVIFREKR